MQPGELTAELRGRLGRQLTGSMLAQVGHARIASNASGTASARVLTKVARGAKSDRTAASGLVPDGSSSSRPVLAQKRHQQHRRHRCRRCLQQCACRSIDACTMSAHSPRS